jgi:hypothetical protein
MKKRFVVLVPEDDLSVDLTLHDFSATLLIEFVEKVVRPYYSGNMNRAIKDLIQRTVREEQFFLSHRKPVNG